MNFLMRWIKNNKNKNNKCFILIESIVRNMQVGGESIKHRTVTKETPQRGGVINEREWWPRQMGPQKRGWPTIMDPSPLLLSLLRFSFRLAIVKSLTLPRVLPPRYVITLTWLPSYRIQKPEPSTTSPTHHCPFSGLAIHFLN